MTPLSTFDIVYEKNSVIVLFHMKEGHGVKLCIDIGEPDAV